MPLKLTGNGEMQTQHLSLLNDLKDESPDKQIKTYNSCLTKNEQSALEFPDPNSKIEELVSIEVNADELEEDSLLETTALRHVSEPSKSSSDDAIMNDSYLTVPGTIKRGKKKGQSVEVVLNMSREELEILEADITTKNGYFCNTKNGFGVLLWTILCFPFSIIISGVYSFCMGTITWYNIFKFFSENKTVGYRILFPPILIVLYPFLIVSISLGLGLYAGLKQLSCCWNSWLKEFTDYEKGFFGWLCDSLDIPECCPYEVVVLSSVQKS